MALATLLRESCEVQCRDRKNVDGRAIRDCQEGEVLFTRLAMRIVTRLALLTLSTVPVSLHAQDTVLVLPGATVRVWSSAIPRGRLVARLEDVSQGGLVLTHGRPPVRLVVPESTVTRLEVRRSTPSGPWTGGLAGLLIGAAAGSACGSAGHPRAPSHWRGRT